MSINWKNFRRDMYERFINFETVNGLYLFPACVFGLYCVWAEGMFKYSIQVGMTIAFFWGAYIGLRKILVNRVKQRLAQETLVQQRKRELNDITFSAEV